MNGPIFYWDLSERERAGLSSEDVEKYLDAELMSKGVLRATLEEPVDDAGPPGPSRRFAVVTNLGRYGSRETLVAFATAHAAEKFIELAPLIIDSDYVAGTTTEFARPLEKPEIVERQIYTQRERDAWKIAIERAGEAAKVQAKRREAYEMALKAQTEALRGVWEDWTRCRELARDHLKVVETWTHYVATARGDEAVAARFLRQVFTDEQIQAASEWYGISVASPDSAFAAANDSASGAV